MSLINDALRRASQTEKNRQQNPGSGTPTGMEAVPVAQGSKVNTVLAVAVVVALLLAGWFFKQWWSARSTVIAPVAVVAPVTPAPQPAPAPVIAPRPAPVVVAATPAPAPAPARVAFDTTPTLAPAPTPVAAPVAPPPPAPAADSSFTWPDLKISAIFYSVHNPRVLINGSIYGVGDQVEGVTLQKIQKNKVILSWNGQTRDLLMSGQ